MDFYDVGVAPVNGLLVQRPAVIVERSKTVVREGRNRFLMYGLIFGAGLYLGRKLTKRGAHGTL